MSLNVLIALVNGFQVNIFRMIHVNERKADFILIGSIEQLQKGGIHPA